MKNRPTDVTVHELDIEVRYVETDQMGVVHHSNYLVWFELARTGLCERSGKTYAEIEQMGLWLMVTGVHIDYRQGARYGDFVRVAAWTKRVGTRMLDFGYDVRRLEPDGTAESVVLARGATEHRWVDARTGRVCRVDDDLLAGFRSL